MQLIDQPLAGAEFLAVDTETNGLGGDALEVVEVGSVLVGGGELHERWSSLVSTNIPLRRVIRRLTGITQDMLEDAPAAAEVLPALERRLRGRVLVAHNAPYDRRALRGAFERSGLEWPNPPVLCTAAMARVLLPLQRERRLSALADALGIEVDVAHRALPDAETCARVFCALFTRLCANAATVGEAVALLKPRRRRRAQSQLPQLVVGDRPELDFSELPRDPGVYLFRDETGRTLYVGKSVSIRSRARAHFAPSSAPAAWSTQASIVDYRPTVSELGALVLENRLIKQLRPPGNLRLTRRDDRLVYIRCRLDIPFPILEVARQPAAGHAVSIGPVRGRALAAELVEQIESLFGLRHCGRRLVRREWPSAYGQMGRCLSPCLGDLDPNLYRRRLDAALDLFLGDGAGALISHVQEQMREAAAEQRFERAAWLRRRAGRLRVIVRRLGGVLEATHVRPRLILAPHPVDPSRRDGFWLVCGRLVDWGPLAEDPSQAAERTLQALAGSSGPRGGAHIPPDEVDEVRIVGAYLASHPDLPRLELEPPPGEAELERFLTEDSGERQLDHLGVGGLITHRDG
ncbi:MAG TPA: exonuclease domain-containing protein [Solirubrobacteraceae bacterium]|nr:exonuclease domain-containing protein [Solirubrobacteraceae bacterium]